MIIFLLFVVISLLVAIVFFLYYSLYVPYTLKKREQIYNEISRQKKFEQIVLEDS